MPLARLTLPTDLPDTKARGLADAVHRALVDTCAVPEADRFQLLVRLPAHAMILDPHFGGVTRSAEACVVEISFLRGRSDAQKRALYADIARGAAEAGLRGDDVLVALTENGPIDWSLGGGVAYAG
jgi:phenylpyruvate tautomerase PptA (4-oxalocrotonate tautomerase family)